MTGTWPNGGRSPCCSTTYARLLRTPIRCEQPGRAALARPRRRLHRLRPHRTQARSRRGRRRRSGASLRFTRTRAPARPRPSAEVRDGRPRRGRVGLSRLAGISRRGGREKHSSDSCRDRQEASAADRGVRACGRARACTGLPPSGGEDRSWSRGRRGCDRPELATRGERGRRDRRPGRRALAACSEYDGCCRRPGGSAYPSRGAEARGLALGACARGRTQHAEGASLARRGCAQGGADVGRPHRDGRSARGCRIAQSGRLGDAAEESASAVGS